MTTKASLATVVEACARAAHEANRAYCLALGDGTHLSWDNTPETIRASCLRGVELALKGDTTPSTQHAAWAADKIANGWIHGPVKDLNKKTHPNLVPYEKLPEAERRKDVLYQAVVRAMAFALNLELRG